MTEIIHLTKGQQLELPVALDHPLTAYLLVRLDTPEEVMKHPFYSKVVSFKQTQGALMNGILSQLGLATGGAGEFEPRASFTQSFTAVTQAGLGQISSGSCTEKQLKQCSDNRILCGVKYQRLVQLPYRFNIVASDGSILTRRSRRHTPRRRKRPSASHSLGAYATA